MPAWPRASTTRSRGSRGCVAIAAVGAVVSAQFSAAVDDRLRGARLDPAARAYVGEAREQPLTVPDGRVTPRVRAAVREAGVDAFRAGMVVSALLMIGGGILAAAGIQNPRRRTRPSWSSPPRRPLDPRAAACARARLIFRPDERARRHDVRALHADPRALRAHRADRIVDADGDRPDGAAVRVTGSGLGCPTWPKCTDQSLYTELNTHGLIEFGNRMLTSVVGFACIAAFAGAFRRRPRRRDLVLLGALLPLGVLAQIVLGGFTVRYDLRPGFVMSHYLLSMLIIVAAVALDWGAHRPEGEPRAPSDRLVALGARALVPVGAITIFAGTAASAAGPHAGGAGTGDVIKRLTFKGADTLRYVIEQHARLATLLGLLAVALWVLARRRGATSEQIRPLTWVCVLLAMQGVVGGVQYKLELPAEIVWVHVTLAALTWVAILVTVAAVGKPLPRGAPTRASGEPAPAP